MQSSSTAELRATQLRPSCFACAPLCASENGRLTLCKVRAAFHEEGAVQRNNFSLLKVFIARWQTVPPPVEAVALHVTAGGPQASKGPKGRLPKPIADQRTFGLRILAACK
jgi:hypothetical protein